MSEFEVGQVVSVVDAPNYLGYDPDQKVEVTIDRPLDMDHEYRVVNSDGSGWWVAAKDVSYRKISFEDVSVGDRIKVVETYRNSRDVLEATITVTFIDEETINSDQYYVTKDDPDTYSQDIRLVSRAPEPVVPKVGDKVKSLDGLKVGTLLRSPDYWGSIDYVVCPDSRITRVVPGDIPFSPSFSVYEMEVVYIP